MNDYMCHVYYDKYIIEAGTVIAVMYFSHWFPSLRQAGRSKLRYLEHVTTKKSTTHAAATENEVERVIF